MFCLDFVANDFFVCVCVCVCVGYLKWDLLFCWWVFFVASV